MKIKFKIFRLCYTSELVIVGPYTDKDGNDYVEHPILKAAGFHRSQWDEYCTKRSALEAIEKYGDDYSEYIIHQIYSK